MAAKRNLATKTTIDNLIGQIKSTFVKQTTFNALNTKVTTLIGEDTNKSVRTIANEELAAQLIPSNADEALDTLQEIASWIQAHPGDAATMNAAITALQNKTLLGKTRVAATGTYVAGTDYYASATSTTPVDTSEFVEGTTDVSSYFVDGPEYANVKAYVESVVGTSGGNLQNAINAVSGRVTAIENIAPTKTEASNTNGNIKIDDVETTVYTLPTDVVKKTDITAGTNNGQVSVQGSDVTVYTLPSEVVKTTDIAAYNSAKNGFISIQGTYTTVYVLPDTVLQADDIVDYSPQDIAGMLADD